MYMISYTHVTANDYIIVSFSTKINNICIYGKINIIKIIGPLKKKDILT